MVPCPPGHVGARPVRLSLLWPLDAEYGGHLGLGGQGGGQHPHAEVGGLSLSLLLEVRREYAGLHRAILCRDCHTPSTAVFHVVGMKCADCGSYNTTIDKVLATWGLCCPCASLFRLYWTLLCGLLCFLLLE